MEPFSKSINDFAINSKNDNIVHGSRMLTIPHIGSDDQLFNENIEEEIADETGSNNYSQLLQKRNKTEEKLNTINTEIIIEKNLIDCYEFEGIIVTENNSSEFNTHLNFDMTSNFKEKSLTVICHKGFFRIEHLKIHTNKPPEKMLYKCDVWKYIQRIFYFVNLNKAYTNTYWRKVIQLI